MRIHPPLKPRKGFKRIVVTGRDLDPTSWANEYLYAVSWPANKIVIYNIERDYRLGWVEQRREYTINDVAWVCLTDGTRTTNTWRGKNGDGSIGKREMNSFIKWAYYTIGGLTAHDLLTYTETKTPV